MQRLSTIFDFVALFATVLVFAACGDRHHTLKQSTAYIGGDGLTNRVVDVEFESGIKLVGQKLDLKDLELAEEVGKDGWKYGVGASSASSSPESIALEFLVDAFKSSQLAQARQGALDPELSTRLERIDRGLADLSAIAERLKVTGSEPE